MNRSASIALMGAAIVIGSTLADLRAESRPNILWITAEDMSPTLGCYGDAYAVTPHIDLLATQSVRYTQAFASAPVCSPSRSCLITGCYATSLGTQQMRSAFPIPKFLRGFPALLREQGYFTTNNVKTDYNTSSEPRLIAESWDENSPNAHWRRRVENSQPFFSVFNLMISHQSRSMVWPREQFKQEVQSLLSPDQIHDPDQAPLPPYYFDTPVIRRTVARFYDCVTAMDRQLGEILKQLEQDGLADDTIVFFYSDHGSGMPRHKRVILDSGMHVPLLIRFPKKYQSLAPAGPGETTDRLVSFVDFGPTVLSLAGVAAPELMQGEAFLGEYERSARQWIFGHRDRIDEAFDTVRSVRGSRYLYVRNYRPDLGHNQPSAWPDEGEIPHEFSRLADDPGITPDQRSFVAPTRPPEELYDCRVDPYNLRNLAMSPAHQDVLYRMRTQHRQHIRETFDAGFLPESEAWNFCKDSTPWEAAREHATRLETVFHAAAQVGVADESECLALFANPDPVVRYWGVIGLRGLHELSPVALRSLTDLLSDASAAVRIEAAGLLAQRGSQQALRLLIESLQTDDLTVVLHATRTIESLGESARRARPAMREVHTRCERIRLATPPPPETRVGDQDLAWFVTFSAGAFLAQLQPDPVDLRENR